MRLAAFSSYFKAYGVDSFFHINPDKLDICMTKLTDANLARLTGIKPEEVPAERMEILDAESDDGIDPESK